MDNILNITNGDCAVEIMRKANIPGVFLPWRDVLHDGPVPDHVSLEALSRVRAEFISSRGWGDLEDIDKEFIERDNLLKYFEKYEKVILWFEHDLYDDDFIDRVLENKLALKIKKADIEDNINVLRLNSLESKDLERVAKYHRAWQKLNNP